MARVMHAWDWFGVRVASWLDTIERARSNGIDPAEQLYRDERGQHIRGEPIPPGQSQVARE
jgi:hypothetical protein